MSDGIASARSLAPYLPSTDSASDDLWPVLGLRRSSDRRFMILLLDEQRPDDARSLVGQCGRDQHTRLSSHHLLKP